MRLNKITSGVAAALVLLAAVAGVPALLVAIGAAPTSAPSLGQLRRVLLDQDQNMAVVFVVLAAVVWFCWAAFTVSTLREIASAISTRGRSSARPWPKMEWVGRPAAQLVAAVGPGVRRRPRADQRDRAACRLTRGGNSTCWRRQVSRSRRQWTLLRSDTCGDRAHAGDLRSEGVHGGYACVVGSPERAERPREPARDHPPDVHRPAPRHALEHRRCPAGRPAALARAGTPEPRRRGTVARLPDPRRVIPGPCARGRGRCGRGRSSGGYRHSR